MKSSALVSLVLAADGRNAPKVHSSASEEMQMIAGKQDSEELSEQANAVHGRLSRLTRSGSWLCSRDRFS